MRSITWTAAEAGHPSLGRLTDASLGVYIRAMTD
jgi:hypothetical protein